METPTPINTRAQEGSGIGLFFFVVVALAGIALYYLYRFLYSAAGSQATILVKGKRGADTPPEKLPALPSPYEGGEYTFSTWIYVNSFSKNMNRRKHIFEIQGKNFSTLIVALGAFKNTLVVRTHSQDLILGEGFQGTAIPASHRRVEEFQGTNTTSATDATRKDGTLAAKDRAAFFAAMAMDDSLLTTPATCDLPEIDLQRWVMVTVVLSGRTIDVYLDGKLARSCVTGSYYKVDPTGVKALVTEEGGFDGYISNLEVANYAMNPDEIYRTYLSGPEGVSLNPITWLASLFQGSGGA